MKFQSWSDVIDFVEKATEVQEFETTGNFKRALVERVTRDHSTVNKQFFTGRINGIVCGIVVIETHLAMDYKHDTKFYCRNPKKAGLLPVEDEVYAFS